MLTSDFDYDLPPELIAQHPVEPRDAARLMVIDRASGSWRHLHFRDLDSLLRPGDLLVKNDSRVIPARLVGRRDATGGAWEGLFLRAREDGCWEILAKTRGKPCAGESITLDRGLSLQLIQRTIEGHWIVQPTGQGSSYELLEQFGHVPLPPYIRKGMDTQADRDRYQTVFAAQPGSVAAPTAGLHFTPELIERLNARGVHQSSVTLHVGIGTFRPIEAETVEGHQLHAEYAELNEATTHAIAKTRASGGRIVAVGTTATRTLEAAWIKGDGSVIAFRGETSLYLKPGHRFGAVDALITNFHLPRSSLLVLVSAFAGYDLIRAAYREAIRERYRFFSYGDAMLIV